MARPSCGVCGRRTVRILGRVSRSRPALVIGRGAPQIHLITLVVILIPRSVCMALFTSPGIPRVAVVRSFIFFL